MKSHTCIEQSKKLAEILPLETADMFLAINGKLPVMSKYILDGFVTADATAIPCWSLAALLEVLESEIDGENGETYKLNIEKDGTWWNICYCEEHDEENSIETTSSEELVDVCYDMIVKLKKKNLI